MNSLLNIIQKSLFGEKICIGDRNSKLGAGREQRQKAPGILLPGAELFIYY